MNEDLIHDWVLLDQLFDRLVSVLLENGHEFSEEPFELEIIEDVSISIAFWGEHNVEVHRKDFPLKVGEEAIVISLIGQSEHLEVNDPNVGVWIIYKLFHGSFG